MKRDIVMDLWSLCFIRRDDKMWKEFFSTAEKQTYQHIQTLKSVIS